MLYQALFFLAAVTTFPYWILRSLRLGKYKRCFWQRLTGILPKVDLHGSHVIWIHAVSVGEVRSSKPLVEKLLSKYPDAKFVISTVTETGQEEAIKSLPFAALHFYLPLDFYWSLHRVIDKLRPDCLIFSETDLWPGLIMACHSRNIPMALVNGKISERSFKRLQWLPWYCQRILGSISMFCLQNQIHAERFQALGVPAERIQVTGNMKTEIQSRFMTGEELENWIAKLAIPRGTETVTLGSTHAPEESDLLDVLLPIESIGKILIVPRHPERFDQVAELLKRRKLPFSRYTSPYPCKERIVLVDTMGVLRKCYQVSTLAIVGGSFIERVGGHNVLEPCPFGVPVLFGPYMQTQPDLKALVIEGKAGMQVSLSTLAKSIENCKSLAQNGIALTKRLQGISDKTVDALAPFLH